MAKTTKRKQTSAPTESGGAPGLSAGSSAKQQRGRPFKPGQSGNPAGRPVAYREHLRRLIGDHGEGAFNIVWAIAQGETRTNVWLGSKDGPVSVAAEPSIRERMDAALALVEHLVGKPSTSLKLDEDAAGDGGGLRVVIEKLPPPKGES